MSKQSLSFRLDDDEVAFLTSIDAPGSKNLSDKLRIVIDEARRAHAGLHAPGAAYELARRQLAQAERRLHESELQADMRSELLSRALSWVPEMYAALAAAAADASLSPEQLRRLERSVAERVIGLVDAIAQLAAAGFPGCYESEQLAARIQPAIRLLQRIDPHQAPTGAAT